jgi:hypothetical protein
MVIVFNNPKEGMGQEGSLGRHRSFAAIQAQYPGFTQVNLTKHSQEQRVTDYGIAPISS